MKLTKKQSDILNNWLQITQGSCGADTWDKLGQDNHSFADINDITEVSKDYSKPQIIGIVASLVDKGLIMLDPDATKNNKSKVWWICDETIDMMIKLESDESSEPKKETAEPEFDDFTDDGSLETLMELVG